MLSFSMDSIVNSAIAEICSELQNGVTLQTLWPRLEPFLASSNIDLSPHIKQALWDGLRSVPTLKFLAGNSLYEPTEPSILSVFDAEKLNLKLVADEGLRNSFMGLYGEPSNSSLRATQRKALERVAMARSNGITQSKLAKELGIEGKNFHYAVKTLECQGLIMKQSAVLRTKEAGDKGDSRNIPIVTTNMLYLYRYGKHLSSQQKIEITKEEQTKESFRYGNEIPASGDGFTGKYVKEDALVKDYLPEMKAVCDKLEEGNGKVLLASDIKKDLGYTGTPEGHKAWRKVFRRLKAAAMVESFDAKVNEKVECCLRLPENSTPMSFEPKPLSHVDDHYDEQQPEFVKRKKCQVTDQLVELPIEHQIYELIDASGSEGLTKNEVMERLGLNSKKYYSQLANMWSRFGVSVQPEMYKKAKTYRFRTSGKQNSESANAFLSKSENANEYKNTDLCICSRDALDRSGQNQTCPLGDCLTMNSDTVTPANVKSRDINTELSSGSPRSESTSNLLSAGNLSSLFLEPKDTTSDSNLGLPGTVMDITGASPETPPTVLKPLGSGSDLRYPCLSLTEISARREKKILERLQDEKFLLRAELYRWLVNLEKDKCTTTDRKTIDRVLKKLQELGHCKCIHINVPVVTNCGRSRTTVVVLHPSIQSLTTELVSKIQDTWRSFEIQSRGQCSSRWKDDGSLPVLEDAHRTQNHVGTDIRTMRSEAMRANGFILAKMIRAKLLHSFLWDFLYGSKGPDDALSSEKDVIVLRNPHSSSKLFSLEEVIKAIPVELFLQVVGSSKKFDDMLEKCKGGLCLSDLSIEEYKSLMDTHATGRLSLVIEILRRLKLIRMVSDERVDDATQIPHAISTHSLELKPYIEEPLSKDTISLSFGSLDLRPRIRHDFVLSNREAVEEYWQTLEYCYAAADPRAALHAFPGSAVHEVSRYRSWTKIRVMTAAQRDELLKRVEKDDPSEKLSFKECGKIAKDLNLTLEQVLRVFYDKRNQRLHGLQNKRDAVQSQKSKRVARKRKRSSEQGSVKSTVVDEGSAQLEDQGHAPLSDTHAVHLQPLADHLETEQETGPNEDDGRCHSIISKCAISNLKSTRTNKKEKLQSTRQRRFSWTEEADRKLVVQYVRQRATLGAKFHRIDWASLADLPAPPTTCQKRMALLKSNRRFRIALMRLCNVISERYAKFLEMTENRSLSKDDCRLPLRSSTGEDHTSNHKEGTVLQEEPWDDFDDNNTKKALEEVLHYKRMGKLDASKQVGSTCEDWSDLNTHAEDYDAQECELNASTTPFEDVQNHSARRLKISARRSCSQHLNEKFFQLLHGVNVSTQVYQSLAVSNAVELFKLVFLSTSTAPEVPNVLAEILRRYSECDLFAAFNYLKDRKIMVGGSDSQRFSLSQEFLHNISRSPFPTNSGKRATKFAHWLHDRDKNLMEGGIDLPSDLQCGEIFHLFAVVSSGELAISPCVPDEGMGEAEDLRSSKRKIDSNEFLDGDKTKKHKPFVSAEGEIITRREKGFPGIKVSVYRTAFPTDNLVDLFKDDAPGETFAGNCQLDSTAGSVLTYSDHMKEILDSASTVSVIENCNVSPWEGMVQYAEHLVSSCSAQDLSSPIHPEVFRSVCTAIQKAGDQGLSMEDVSQITNIPGIRMTEFIVEVLQTFERVLKVNAYDSVRVVDALYRGKYFMTSVSGICQNLESPSWRKPQGGNGEDLILQPKKCDIGGGHLDGDINVNVDDVHKVTFLNFPEEVFEVSCAEQTSTVAKGCMEGKEVSRKGDDEDESFKSYFGKLSVPILPWINGDGTINKIIYKGLTRRVLGFVMQNPGMSEDEIIRRMDVLNPQSCRRLLELLILDKQVYVRKMHQSMSNGPPSILRTLFGSSFTEPKMVFREHFFANPMSTSSL